MELQLPILILSIVGLIFGVVLSVASVLLFVAKDPRISKVEEALPSANCGACGFPGCAAFAAAVIKGIASPNGCLPGGADTAGKIADLLGVEADEIEEMMAVVHCAGGSKEAKERAIYDGIHDCWGAQIVSNGSKSCSYGCFGLSSCVKVCAFDALHINANGIAEVDPLKCTGCEACVEACPRDLIEMIPKSQSIFLACNTKDRGAKVKSYCSVGCTGCTLCVKAASHPEAIRMENFLPILSYNTNENFVNSKHKCPSNCFTDLAPARPKANIDSKCTGCGDCVVVCPVKGAITGEPHERYVVDKKLCIGCGLCVPSCPESSISMWGALGIDEKNRRSSTSRHMM